ncbi:MAG: ATP-grasp domain-containing protein [Bacteroidales bacterium]|nr:ATP-grasp domain-containing protein [Bacteroidales bacterium]
MKDDQITLAVSGLNNTDNPGPGVPVIRALREASGFRARIIGLAYENMEPGVYMEGLADRVYLVPYPSGGIEPMLARIEEIHQKEEIDVLIPNFDAELLPLIKSGNRLSNLGIHTFLPTIEQYEDRLKSNLPEFGKKYDILVPQSLPVSSALEIPSICRQVPGPWMIKGKFYDAYLAHNPDQAVEYFYRISAKWGLPVVIQQFIQGTEVNVVALGDGQGNVIGAVPMRKMFITDKGKAWSGISISDPNLLEITHKIISQTGWRGGMELEMIRTADQKYYLVEINPRIPAWVYLAVGAGQNLPEALVKLAMGWPVEPFHQFAVGKIFVRYSYEMIIEAEEHQLFAITGEKTNP